jgi:hypothetical protein
MIVNMFCKLHPKNRAEEETIGMKILTTTKNSIPLSLEWLALMQNKRHRYQNNRLNCITYNALTWSIFKSDAWIAL